MQAKELFLTACSFACFLPTFRVEWRLIKDAEQVLAEHLPLLAQCDASLNWCAATLEGLRCYLSP